MKYQFASCIVEIDHIYNDQLMGDGTIILVTDPELAKCQDINVGERHLGWEMRNGKFITDSEFSELWG